MVILFPIILAFEITDDEPSDILDFMDYIFWLITLFGVLGYCYKINILTKTFWKSYLPFMIIWDLFIVFRDVLSDPELQDPYFYIFLVVFGLLFIFPGYIGVYLYGYKANE